MSSSESADSVLEVPLWARFVLWKVVLVAVNANRLRVDAGTVIEGAVIGLTTSLANGFASALIFEVSVPKTVKTHLNWGNINVDWVSDIKKIDKIWELLVCKGEANSFGGDKLRGTIGRGDSPLKPFSFSNGDG